MAWRALVACAAALVAAGCSEATRQVSDLKKAGDGEGLVAFLLDRAASGENVSEDGALREWSGADWSASDAVVALASSDAAAHDQIETALLAARDAPRGRGEAMVAETMLYYVNRDAYDGVQKAITDLVIAEMAVDPDAERPRIDEAFAFPGGPLARGAEVDAIVSWWDPVLPDANIGNTVRLALSYGPSAAEIAAYSDDLARIGVINRRREREGDYIGCEGAAFRYVTDVFVLDVAAGVIAKASVAGGDPPILAQNRGAQRCDSYGSRPDESGYLALREE